MGHYLLRMEYGKTAAVMRLVVDFTWCQIVPDDKTMPDYTRSRQVAKLLYSVNWKKKIERKSKASIFLPIV